jgi:hypothetical protein
LQSPPSLFPLKITQREIEMIPGLNYYTLNTSIGGSLASSFLTTDGLSPSSSTRRILRSSF